jgi:hypothetical protein
MSEHRDQDLRRAFGALNDVVQASAPAFEDLTSSGALTGARRRHRRRRVAAAAIVVSILAILAVRARPKPGPDFERFTALTGLDLGEVTWKAPTDFLLDVPGIDLLRTIPLADVVVPPDLTDSAPPTDSNVNRRRRSS